MKEYSNIEDQYEECDSLRESQKSLGELDSKNTIICDTNDDNIKKDSLENLNNKNNILQVCIIINCKYYHIISHILKIV